jgi:tripartite-type tricarboxylate transporter receptor subunit TctC
VPVAGDFGYDFLPPQMRGVVVRADTNPQRVALLSASLDRFAAGREYATYLRDQLACPTATWPPQPHRPSSRATWS